MKRIDDKIQEIEKKDKTNRRLYLGFVMLIAVFMAYVLYSENQKSKLDNTIATQEGTISEGIIKREKTNEELKATLDSLQNSLRPVDYWEYTERENTVEGYIAYITNDWGIDKTQFLSKAIANLKSSETIGFQGWLFVGSKNADGIYTTDNVVEVILPVDNRDDFKISEIQTGDIVQLTTTRNRKTYVSETSQSSNTQGWRNKTKGFVTDIWEDPNSTNFKIQIKYY